MIQKNRVRMMAVAALAVLLSVPVVSAQAQTAIITGKVQAESGAPVEGAQVLIADVNASQPTNQQGVYTITIPSARVSGQQVVVRVRAIGFAPETRTISLTAGTHTENFTMKQDVNRLSEVVVTGTAGGEGVERSKVPYSIARITEADIPVPQLDPVRALQGKIPGVRIASISGAPGATPSILMRGPTSINASGRSQSPLIVVDGTIMRNGNLDELGGLDIESVEVVKGAAGSTLYGTAAASGVINIKTKRGNSRDGISFNVRSEVGASDAGSVEWGVPVNHALQLDETGTRFCVVTSNLPSCSRTLEWMREFQRINGVVGDTTRVNQAVQFNSPSGGDLTNIFQANIWPGRYYNQYAGLITKNLVTISSLDASGRVGSVRFFASGQYTDNEGGVRGGPTQTNQRARVNLDYDARSDLLISVSTAFNKNIGLGGSTPSFSAIQMGMPPGTNTLARDTLGRTFVVVGGTGFRPANGGGGLYNAQEWSGNYSYGNRFLGNLSATYNPAEWVTLGGTFAYDNRATSGQSYNFRGRRVTRASTTSLGSMSISNNYDEAMNGNVNATFRKSLTSDLNTKLSLSALGEQLVSRDNSGSGSVFIVKDIFTLSNTSTSKSSSSGQSMDRSMGVSSAVNADYKDRYILEGAIRYDGNSRFGEGERWAPFNRISGVWRVSQEPFFNVPGVTDFRLRGSRGTAGKTPSFSAQYETYSCSSSGCSLGQAGNKLLKPETTTEVELGTDATLFDRLGVELTHISGTSKNQILNVPTIMALGFRNQWQNAGTLANHTWELGLTLPVVTRRDFNWSMRGTWDRTRTYITELFIPEYFTDGATGQGTGSFFKMTASDSVVDGYPQNRYGNLWGRKFYKSCAELPNRNGVDVTAMCGEGKDLQVNDQGWVVWVGAGNSWRDGITKNLWQTKLPAASSPWNFPLSFGSPIIDRPLRGEANEGQAINHILGNTLPDFRITYGNNLQYKKLTAYALLDATVGNYINNQMEGWGLLDMSSSHFDQAGTTVETAKPVGYGWRVGAPEGVGSGGFYDILGPNNYNVEKGSYTKLREVSLQYRVGRIRAIGGDWTVGVIGRNMYTWTKYSGIDPEIGVSGGQASSGLINATDDGSYPALRTFTFNFSTRY